jgi:hypothetical protein
VQSAPRARRVPAPESGEDAAIGRHGAGPAREKRQDGHFGRSERDPRAFQGDFAAEEVDLKRAATVEASPPAGVEAAQFGDAHAGRQIPRPKGTGEIIRIEIKNRNAVRLAIAATEGNDVRLGIRAPGLAELVEIGRRQIDDDDVERPIRRRRAGKPV